MTSKVMVPPVRSSVSKAGSQRRTAWIHRSRAGGSWGPIASFGVLSDEAQHVLKDRLVVPAVHRRPKAPRTAHDDEHGDEHGDALGRMSPIEYVLQNRTLTPDGYATPSGRLSPDEADGSRLLTQVADDNNAQEEDEHKDGWDRVLQDARSQVEGDARLLAAGKDIKGLYPNCHVHIWLRSCKEEVAQPLRGTVKGDIPKWVRGTLLRNGPGSLECGTDRFQHLFDGAALLQRFCIVDGEVTYQSRFLRSQTWRRNAAAGRIVVTEFGTRAVQDPCQTIFKRRVGQTFLYTDLSGKSLSQLVRPPGPSKVDTAQPLRLPSPALSQSAPSADRVAAMFNPGEVMSDNAMISVYPVGDEFYAFTESPVMTRVDPVSLHTLDRVNMSSSLGIVNHSSHPLVQEDGSVVNLGMNLSATGPQYCLIHFPAPQPGAPALESVARGRLQGGVSARWPLHPGYMHSFGATACYFVLVEQPLSVSVPAMVRGQLSGDPLAASLRWFPEHPTLIHLVSRATGKRTHTFQADSFFFLHVINCFERPSLAAEECANDPGEVLVDICCYKDPAMISCMYIDALKEAQRNPDYALLFRGRPLRFVLPLGASGSRVQPRQLCDLGCETPRLNPQNVSKAYRFFYAISSDVDADNPGTLIKVDTWTGTCSTWGEEGVYPSEPIFVSTPGGTLEDDGVLLCALVWGDDDRRSGLLVVNATTMLEVGRAEFSTPSQVPKCLHGWFAPSIV